MVTFDALCPLLLTMQILSLLYHIMRVVADLRYIKAESDVHLAIRRVGYDGQEVDCSSSWRYVRTPALLT